MVDNNFDQTENLNEEYELQEFIFEYRDVLDNDYIEHHEEY